MDRHWLDEVDSLSSFMVDITDSGLTTCCDSESARQCCLKHRRHQKTVPLSLAVMHRSVASEGAETTLKMLRNILALPGKLFISIIGIMFLVA